MSIPIAAASIVLPSLSAAVVAAVVSLGVTFLSHRRDRRDRQRQCFGDAYAAIVEYQEFAYIVRRRQGDSADDNAISRALSECQGSLVVHGARLEIEAPRVAHAYQDLVKVAKQVAGASIRDGWTQPLGNTMQMNVTSVDLSEIQPAAAVFLEESRCHLSFRSRSHRSLSSITRRCRSSCRGDPVQLKH